MKLLPRFPIALTCLLAAIMLAGCASSYVESNVSKFHQLPPRGSGQTFFITRSEKHQEDLAHESYESRIRGKLKAYGWENPLEKGPIVKNLPLPDYVVVFDYMITGGKTISQNRPIYGVTGGGTSLATGTVSSASGTASYSGMTQAPLKFGQVGTATDIDTLYGRMLVLDIYDTKSNKKVFQGEVRSTGSSSQLSAIMPLMIESLFKGFPGKSGEVKTIELPMSQ